MGTRIAVLCFLLTCGCDESTDPGPRDAGRTPGDAGAQVDAGTDAGTLDAGSTADAGSSAFSIDTAPGAEIRGRPSISFDGADFLVVWRDTLVTPYAFRAGRITPAGVRRDPGGKPVGTTTSTGYGTFPGMAFDGTNHLMVWAEPNGAVLGLRVSKDAVPVDTAPLTIGAGSKIRPISVAFNGTNYLVAWRTLSDEIRVTRVSTAGVVLDSVAGTVLGNGFYPWIATDGQDFLVVWEGNGVGGIDIYANRVSGAGAAMDGPAGFLVSQAAEAQSAPSVAFNGTDYLVVWHDKQGGDVGLNDGTARGSLVSRSGMVSPPVVIGDPCRSQWPVAVSSSGSEFLVVWQVDHGAVDPWPMVDVFARRISGAGQVSGAPFQVIGSPGNQWGPVVGFGSGSYLVAWSEGGPMQGTSESGVWGRIFPAL